MKSAAPAAPLTVAVILAGGSGQRIGLSIPKQLIKIAGKTILEHTLAVFDEAPGIDHVILMMHPGFVAEAEAIVAGAGLRRPVRIVPGGDTRNATTELSFAAVSELTGGEDGKVLFHDAVRPLVSQRIIQECIDSLDTYRAVDVAIPSSDTIIVTTTTGMAAGEHEIITDVPDRSRLRRGQTPQAFWLSTIRRAYALAAGDPGFVATDDCTVVLRYLPDTPIHVVAGEERNMKVTQPIDIHIADKLFQLSTSTLAEPIHPEDYREYLTGKTLVVLGGSYGIGADIAALAGEHGARVFSFSRSTTGTDVADPESVAAALEHAYVESGRIDYVVNTAGVLRIGRLADLSAAEVDEALRVNFIAPASIARAAHAYLAKSRGQLLLFTSSSYTRGRAEYSLYSSAKAAVVNLTQALGDEWSGDGIRVNCVNPERTLTPMRVQAFGEEPAGSLLSSRTVARASLDVLISDITGQIVDVRRDTAPAAL
ncbi:bifunctional cytidylyltransferase/SDR family oxidoreductase [Kitasatospora camelliae]|uniref:2-C-methyl-D-erythritol 4-phosphate cytidylyltransferase n=1 Tax=Kitasatospora camelliae TaxID=3156397 RepID=A0AAU8K0R8_9ACTN